MKKFIVYLTAGYPSLEDSFYFMEGISDLVDAIEIGFPFTDPLADGPVIQVASSYALKNSIKLADIFEKTSKLSEKVNINLYYMTYYNLVYHYGVDRFVKRAKKVGVRGLIVPDLPLEESSPLLSAMQYEELEPVMFISPVTDNKRAIKIANASKKGFLYYVSVTGVTGERKQVNKKALLHIADLKRRGISKEIFIGFGISSPDQVREALKVADGVIVGSAIIKQIDPSLSRGKNLERIRRKIKWLKAN